MINLGTSYANFTIPEAGIFNSDSICYFAGVGEDFIFDCEFVQRFGCKGFLIDPTPQSKAHFEKVRIDPTTSPIPKSKDYVDYSKFADVLASFTYCDFGLAAYSDVLKFHPPSNPESVSHSLTHIKCTEPQDGFSAQCYTLRDTMQMLGHEHLDFLKMNIEGAELEILYEIVTEEIPVKTISVDFDYLKRDRWWFDLPTSDEMIFFLESAGFELLFNVNLGTTLEDHMDARRFTFINRTL